MTTPIYAIGDIHGRLEFLERALALIETDGGSRAEIVFLGDLVDRGPDSRKVIDRLMAGQSGGRAWHVLRGNHDRMFLRFARGGKMHDARIMSGLGWLHPRLGGRATLASYGVPAADGPPDMSLLDATRAAVPAAHLDWLGARPLFHERGDLLFVHAGIRPGLRLSRQTEDDLIWIREPFLSFENPHPWLVVHGHTALDRPQHFGNRINLDGGAGYGRPIHPAVFEGSDCWLLSEAGRQQLLPQNR